MSFEPVATVTRESWPGNAEGEAKFTRPTMARFIVEDGDLPEIKEKASLALEQAGFPKTDRGKAEAICAFARSVMSYVSDPPMRETVYRPRYLLCVAGAKLCVKIGDCGNMNCALGALMRAAGLDVKVQGIEYGGGAQDHVNIVVYLADEGKWAEADATTNAPVGASSRGRKILYDPHDAKVTGAGVASGAFIGAGRPMQNVSMAQVLFGRDVVPVGRIGAGLVTPGDVLSYRKVWDQYVLDTVRCCLDCGQAFQDTAAANPSNSQSATLAALGKQYVQDGDNLYAQWNTYKSPPMTNEDIVLNGATILQTYQQVVLACSKERGILTTGTITCALTYHDASGNVVAAVPGPDPNVQARIIAQIEGLGILASGVLQVLVDSGANGLQASGNAAQWVAQHAASTGSWILSPWTWGIAATLLVGTVGVVVYNADKVSKLVSTVTPLGAREPNLRRRRRRRKIARR